MHTCTIAATHVSLIIEMPIRVYTHAMVCDVWIASLCYAVFPVFFFFLRFCVLAVVLCSPCCLCCVVLSVIFVLSACSVFFVQQPN